MMDREDRENLVDFLEEADLNQYYELFRSTLKVTKASQLKFVMTEDLVQIGLSKPEQRRYKKMYSKHFPNPYLAKIRSFFSLSNRRDDASTSRGGAPPLEMQPFPENVVKVPTKHIISIDDITMNKELGMGQFGVVQQGTWSTGNQRIQVAIKCLGQERMTSNSSEFLKEAAVMHTIEHPNIVRLYGVVLHMDSLMLVTELAPLRSLLECLRELSLRPYFPIPNLCDFAEQICDGMTYLEKKRLIHRDLAARNILVFNKDRVKISDFGLSRALGVGKDYYQTNYNVNLKLPVAWCAPECILYLRFTLASDVWAFGVCLWEIFTYGFQPWAAFSGQQILEAIDAPNFQRLERPDCCPEAYYAVMLQCWAHDPAKRPRFKDLKPKLKNIRAEQVQAICDFKKEPDEQRTNLLEFKSGQIITVLGKHDMTKSSFWYGILPGGQSGMFNPDSTKRYVKLEKPPTAVSISPPPSRQSGRSLRTSLQRTDVKRQTYTGKRPLQLSMISAPQGDVRHTGHIGADGMFFGDISFLNPEPPRQVVSPYKPSEDLEQVPLINPNSPSHLSAAAAAYPMLGSNTPTDDGRSTSRSSNKSHRSMEPTTSKSILNKIAQVKNATLGRSNKSDDNAGSKNDEHEYHEISDTDTESNAADNLRLEPLIIPDSPGIPRSYADFSQSLLAEMESMFRTIDETRARAEPESFRTDVSVVHRSHTMSKAEKKKGAGFDTGTMKPMSAHDQKTLDTACAMANEITTKSMTDLGGESKAAQPPAEKSKFHFRFPHLSINLHGDSDSHDKKGSKDRRNFSDEANSVPNIQESLSEESKRAYVSLIEEPVAYRPPLTLPPEDLLTYPSSPSPPAIPARRPFISVPNPYFRERARSKPKPAYARRAQSEGSLPRNPLPLPPRTTKPKLVDKPRHIRKNALLLSPVGGLPRLAKPPKTPIYQNTPAMLYRSVADDDDDSVDGYLLEEPLSCNEESRDGDDEGELTPKPEEAPLAKDLDHVSVEDLLEFAGVKPCGRQRGIESDEVRIMCKVLKKQVPPETCLQALELNDWNVHNSIKLIYLKLSASPERSLDTCYEQLQAAGGDPANALLALNDLIT